ncbi:MAG: MgtC/SapB family protein [Clostridia bacterium]|nr:MgtC/SapB family protein [Clostridia bacterium]
MTLIKQLYLCIPILISAILGFIIGLERRLRKKEAGIRTHTILCIGSCLMMVISLNAFGDSVDKSRVASQIVSGIGFLGAGMIVLKKHEVYGLTTAAGVWATAGIGMACGAKLYLLSSISTILLVVVQCVLHLNFKIFNHKNYCVINIVFEQSTNEYDMVKNIFNVSKFNHLKVDRNGDKIIYKASLNISTELSSTALTEIIKTNPFILSLERYDDL